MEYLEENLDEWLGEELQVPFVKPPSPPPVLPKIVALGVVSQLAFSMLALPVAAPSWRRMHRVCVEPEQAFSTHEALLYQPVCPRNKTTGVCRHHAIRSMRTWVMLASDT